MDTCLSLNQLAEEMNKAGVRTKRGKLWTKASVYRLSKDYDLGLGHTEKDQKHIRSAIIRKESVIKFAKNIEKEYLPHVYMKVPDYVIALQLNEMGVKTRMGGNWCNVSVKRMKKILEIK